MIQDPSGLSGSTISQIVAGAMPFVYVIMGLVFFGMIVYAGFTWLMSEGNPEKINKAISILVWAVIGIIVVVAAGAIVNLFQSATGITFQ